MVLSFHGPQVSKKKDWNFKKAEIPPTPDIKPAVAPQNMGHYGEDVGQHGILTVGRMDNNVRVSLGVQGYGQLYTHFNVEEAVHIAGMILQQCGEIFKALKEAANAQNIHPVN